MDSQKENTKNESGGQGHNVSDLLLQDKGHIRADIKTVNRAVRNGWAVPDAKRKEIVSRLLDVVNKREVAVMTKEGPAVLDEPADRNAVAAARVLVAMDQVDQTDHWNQDKNDRLDSGKLTDRMAVQPQVTLRGIPEDVDVDPPAQ